MSNRKKEDEVICLCARKEDLDEVHPHSLEASCSVCGCEVWCMPHNLDKVKMCRGCLEEKLEREDDVDVCIMSKDKRAFMDFIRAKYRTKEG